MKVIVVILRHGARRGCKAEAMGMAWRRVGMSLAAGGRAEAEPEARAEHAVPLAGWQLIT